MPCATVSAVFKTLVRIAMAYLLLAGCQVWGQSVNASTANKRSEGSVDEPNTPCGVTEALLEKEIGSLQRTGRHDMSIVGKNSVALLEANVRVRIVEKNAKWYRVSVTSGMFSGVQCWIPPRTISWDGEPSRAERSTVQGPFAYCGASPQIVEEAKAAAKRIDGKSFFDRADPKTLQVL